MIYEKTARYVFLELFREAAKEYELEERISFTVQEFGSFVDTAEKILESIYQEKSAREFLKSPTNKGLNSNTKVSARTLGTMYKRSRGKVFFKQFYCH